MPNHLTLKWGTLKGYSLESKDCPAFKILERYYEQGVSLSAMAQRDTPEQKAILCELIDAVDEPIYNDWSGEEMTREQAKKYVMEYDS